MPIPSKSLPQVPTSWHEPALPAFVALCDEAVRRCSAQHALPVTPSAEMRLRAWQLCWLALDAASAPANNLPDTVDAQSLPPALVEQLRAALPQLNTQTWQELRRARDQQLFDALPPPDSSPHPQALADDALAQMLATALASLGLEQLRGWTTASVTGRIAGWLSACLLAIDALALSDDNADLAALELVVFVQSRLQPLHDAASAAESKPEPSIEQAPATAAAVEPQPVASPAAPTPALPDLAESPAAPQVSKVLSQSSSAVPAPDSERSGTSSAPTPPRRSGMRLLVQVASAVAVAALLLLMLRSGDVSTPPAPPRPNDVPAAAPTASPERPAQPTAQPEPPAAEPAASALEPTGVPKPSSAQPQSSAIRRPRLRNLTEAKRAHAAHKLDDAAYAAAVAELEAQRDARVAKEKLQLSRGKLTQAEYKRKVDAINRTLGFDRR